jgi:hypothetical protein
MAEYDPKGRIPPKIRKDGMSITGKKKLEIQAITVDRCHNIESNARKA